MRPPQALQPLHESRSTFEASCLPCIGGVAGSRRGRNGLRRFNEPRRRVHRKPLTALSDCLAVRAQNITDENQNFRSLLKTAAGDRPGIARVFGFRNEVEALPGIESDSVSCLEEKRF